MVRDQRFGAWGDCNLDRSIDKIVSPYPYKTAGEHYSALLTEAKKAGGPTVHTRQTLPNWDGATVAWRPGTVDVGTADRDHAVAAHA
jgi:hypothetical protein